MGFIGDAIGGIAGGVADAAGGLVGKVAGGLGGGLLKMIFPQVDGVLGQFKQAENLLQDLVKSPVNAMLKEVEDGGIWTGPGAEAFKQDLTSAFLPDVQRMGDIIANMGKWMEQSKDGIQQADDDALKEVESLTEFFGL